MPTDDKPPENTPAEDAPKPFDIVAWVNSQEYYEGSLAHLEEQAERRDRYDDRGPF